MAQRTKVDELHQAVFSGVNGIPTVEVDRFNIIQGH